MAYVIYLICCAIHGVMMAHLDVSIVSLEYWISFSTIIAAWMCGRTYEKTQQND